MSTSGFSLEPPPIIAYDGRDDDLFAPPARLLDVTAEGVQVFTRADPEKSISERLVRIWQERGDFSLLSAAGIRAAEGEQGEEGDEGEEEEKRPSVEEMRELHRGMMEQLVLARQELSTALDLISVVTPLTDPPTINPESLPLPAQTLTIVPSIPPPAPSSDPAVNPLANLPLATSIASIQSSANAFFAASENLLPSPSPSPSEPTKRAPSKPPSLWPTLLHLRSTTPHTLLPLGTGPGASLSGKGEVRAAREVGVFFGCEEAKEGFRRGSVARVRELVGGEEGGMKGRMLVVKVKMDGVEDRVVWKGAQGVKGVEATLEARARSAFAEELFAVLSNEARTDASLKAKLVLGKRSEGDSIITEGHGWTLTLTLVSAPSDKLQPIAPPSSSTAAVLLPLLRLLFLQEYAQRRAGTGQLPYSRPLLQTLSTFLAHTHRLDALVEILKAQKRTLEDSGLRVRLKFFGEGGVRERVKVEDAGEAVLRVLRGDRELGGRAVLSAGHGILFHLSYSLLLPHQATPSSIAATANHQSLVWQAPRAGPVAIPSTAHLRLVLEEQVARIGKRARSRVLLREGARDGMEERGEAM